MSPFNDSSQSTWVWFAGCQDCDWRSEPTTAIAGVRVAGRKHEEFDRDEPPFQHTTEVRSEDVSPCIDAATDLETERAAHRDQESKSNRSEGSKRDD